VGVPPRRDADEVDVVGIPPRRGEDEVDVVGIPKLGDADEVDVVGIPPRRDADEVTVVGIPPRRGGDEVTVVGIPPRRDADEVNVVGIPARRGGDEVRLDEINRSFEGKLLRPAAHLGADRETRWRKSFTLSPVVANNGGLDAKGPSGVMATPTHHDVITKLTALIDGLTKYIPNESSMFAGQAYTGAELIAQVGVVLAAEMRVVNAQGELKEALLENDKTKASNAPLLNNLTQRLRARYSHDSVTLAEFGIEPVKIAEPMGNDQLLARAAKSKATRKERNTLGKKQKAAIMGTVSGVVIAPVTKKGPTGK
jgi:hypothetical protein